MTTARFVTSSCFAIALGFLTFGRANAASADDFSARYQNWKSLESHGEYAAALKEAEAVRAICVERYGAKHAHTGRVLTELSSLYVECGKYKEAADAGRKALEINENTDGKESTAVATALLHLGRADLWMRRFDQAEERFRRSQAILEKQDAKQPLLVQIAREQCLLHADARNPKEAVEFGRAAVSLAEQRWGSDHVEAALSLMRLGRALYEAGETQKAETTLLASLQTLKARFGPQHPQVGLAVYWLGWVYKATGRIKQAEDCLAQSAQIFESKLGSEHMLLGFIQNDYGVIAEKRGDLSEAEQFFDKALKLKQACDAEVMLTLVNLGNVYGQRRQLDKAQVVFERALKMSEELFGPDADRTGFALMNYGVLHAVRRNFAESISMQERSLSIFEKHKGLADPQTIRVRANLALLYQITGEPELAQKLFDDTIRDSESRFGAHTEVIAKLRQAHGAFLANQGDLAAATEKFRQAASVFESIYGPYNSHLARVLLNEAECCARQEQWEAAISAADRALRIQSTFAQKVLPGLSEQEQLDFLTSLSTATFVNPLTLASTRPSELAIVQQTAEWALNSKALRWTVLSDRARRTILTGDPQRDRLAQEVFRLREQLAALFMKPPAAGKLEKRMREIEELTRRIDVEGVKLSGDASHVKDIASWKTVDEVRKAIPNDSVLVELVCQRRRDYSQPAKAIRLFTYGAWVIPPEGQGSIAFVNLGPADDIDQAVREAREEIAQSPLTIAALGEKESEKRVQSALARLADLILRPLERHLTEKNNWIISPDSSLWLVPWAALPLVDDSYVVERHAVRFVTTGRELLNKPGHNSAGAAVIVADPDYDLGRDATNTRKAFRRLPGTAREAEEIAPRLKALFKQDPAVFTGQQATEERVKQVHEATTVLLSTHGFFFDVPWEQNINPLLCCGLAFAGANNHELSPSANDGILTGLEICSLDLRGTRLVVLSACDTGVGRVNQGEGVAGLRQAFQLAGAEAVLASLWSVADEETATLMSSMFEELVAGRNQSSALRKAQLKMIKARRAKHEAAHPAFWAAFTLTSPSP